MEPILKIVPREQIVPIMEFNSDRAAYLEIAYAEAGYVFNPILVAEVADSLYLLTDDGSGLEALARLDVGFIPVQVEPVLGDSVFWGKIAVKEWRDDFLREFQRLFPRDTNPLPDDGNPDYSIYARCYHGDIPGPGMAFKRNGFHASQIVVYFIDYLRRHRALAAQVLRPFGGAPDMPAERSAAVRIGNLKFTEAVWLGQKGFRFPAGFYHPDDICRVLGVNYPIKILNEKASVNDKQAFLHELIAFRMKSGRTESYNGGVFLLNY